MVGCVRLRLAQSSVLTQSTTGIHPYQMRDYSTTNTQMHVTDKCASGPTIAHFAATISLHEPWLMSQPRPPLCEKLRLLEQAMGCRAVLMHGAYLGWLLAAPSPGNSKQLRYTLTRTGHRLLGLGTWSQGPLHRSRSRCWFLVPQFS